MNSEKSTLEAPPRNAGTFLSIVLFIGVVGGWELAVRMLGVSSLLMPPPSAIAISLWDLLFTASFWRHAGFTLWETLGGFGIGASAGLIIGGVVGQFYLMERVVYPYVVAFQAIPKVAIAPIFVVWFGYGVTSKIVIAATIAFFPVLANTIVGLRSVPRDQIDMLRSFTASRWQIFKMAKTLQALPYIFAGMDISIMMAVIGAIVGEFVGAQAGLGFLIMQKNFAMDIAGTFAVLLVLSVVGIALNACMQAIRRRVVFWVDDEHSRTSP